MTAEDGTLLADSSSESSETTKQEEDTNEDKGSTDTIEVSEAAEDGIEMLLKLLKKLHLMIKNSRKKMRQKKHRKMQSLPQNRMLPIKSRIWQKPRLKIPLSQNPPKAGMQRIPEP